MQKVLLNLGPHVLNGQFHCSPQTIPITGCFGDAITNLFWNQTQVVYNGGQDRHGTDFLTGVIQVYDCDLAGVELWQYGAHGWVG